MIKILLTTLISVFVAILIIVSLFWRDDQYDPSIQDFVIYLGLLPLGITLLILSPYLTIKWLKHRKEKQEKQKTELSNVDKKVEQKKETQEPEYFEVNVYSASIQHSLGENTNLVEKIVEMSAPQLDTKLLNAYGNPILSYRIDELDDLNSESESYFGLSELQQRIEGLIQHQLQENTQVIYQVINHLKQSALFYDTQLAYEYRMHPAWVDPSYNSDDDVITTADAKKVAKLNKLNIHIILADTLLHVWDESSSSEIIETFLVDLGVISAQINIEYSYWGNENSTHDWFNFLKKVHQSNEEVTFVIAADSEIDQDTVDNRMWASDAYIPAEFSSSCCIASPQLEIEDLIADRDIHFALSESDINHFISHLKIEESPQFEEEVPFVVIPDDMTKVKVIRNIEQNFKDSPIQSHHFILAKNVLGNTQSLSKIFSFILTLNLNENGCNFFYSQELPYTQTVVKPKNSEPVADQNI